MLVIALILLLINDFFGIKDMNEIFGFNYTSKDYFQGKSNDLHYVSLFSVVFYFI